MIIYPHASLVIKICLISKMNSLECVGTLLIEHLEEALTFGPEVQNYLLIAAKTDYAQRVYDSFFNWITDPAQSPESIIHLLDTYIWELNGFSTNRSIQILVSFPCLDALARRRPAVLQGPWEKLAFSIINYFAYSNTVLGKRISHFQTVNEATLKWIVEFSTPELCPNPCLRLELFRLMRSFNRDKFDYDRVSFRDNVINTIFEVFENHSSLPLDQLPNFSPMDLQLIIRDNNISMGFIMNECDLYPKRYDIIKAMFKLTRNLAVLEKERHLRPNNQFIGVEMWNIGLTVQLSCCLSFCGLIPSRSVENLEDKDFELEYNDSLHYFVKTIGNDPFLLDIVIHTLETITDASLCFPDEHALHAVVTYEKEGILHRFFKDHIRYLPKHQYLQEIHGGFTPAAEYRLRYLQYNQFGHSESDSEYYDNGNDNGSHVSEENYSELDISDE